MKKIKLFKRLLAAVVLTLSLPQWAAAYDFMVDGLCYDYNSDGTSVTVTYQNSSSPRYSDLEGDLVIPETVTYSGTTYSVTSIGYYAFIECTSLTMVTIPNSVTSIGYQAFSGCSGLTSVSIPNSVTSIGNYAFYGTTWYNNQPDGLVYAGLVAYKYKGTMPDGTSSSINSGTKGIAAGCFFGCSGLTSVTIPNSVTSIGDEAFYGCTSLTSVTIGNSVTSIGGCAFYNCSRLTSVTIPNSVNTIGERAFYGTAWYNNQPDGLVYAGLVAYLYKGTMPDGTSIVINNGTKGITDYCFSGCSGLTSVTIPNSVTSIGYQAFSGCSGLTSVTIPNSVTSIGNGAFSYYDRFSLNRTLTICGGVETIGNDAFGSYSSSYRNVATLILKDEVVNIKNLGVNPTRIYTYATTPPECDNNSFTGYNATLHVPASAMAAYFTAPYWQNFANIVGDAVEPTSLTLSADTAYVKLGSQLNLQATLQPSNTGLSIAWSTSDASIATVNNNGVVNALQPGECDITVTCADLIARCHVVVLEQQITITLDKHELTLETGTITTLTPTMTPAPTELMVASSDRNVAAARLTNGQVQVLAVKPGVATITVSSVDGNAQPDSCVVTVPRHKGDVNCDGYIDVSDVNAIINMMLGKTSIPEATEIEFVDINGDEHIDVSDVNAVINIMLGKQ